MPRADGDNHWGSSVDIRADGGTQCSSSPWPSIWTVYTWEDRIAVPFGSWWISGLIDERWHRATCSHASSATDWRDRAAMLLPRCEESGRDIDISIAQEREQLDAVAVVAADILKNSFVCKYRIPSSTATYLSNVYLYARPNRRSKYLSLLCEAILLRMRPRWSQYSFSAARASAYLSAIRMKS